jgi:hypothetical protein
MKTIRSRWTLLALVLLLLALQPASAFYDPGVQRWLNRDPLREAGFQLIRKESATALLSINLYEFAYNSAPNEVDSFGLQIITPIPIRPLGPAGKCTISEVNKCSATCRALGASGSCYVLTVPISLPCGGFYMLRVPICICWTWKIPPPWTP